MQKIKSITELKEAILLLEIKQVHQGILLKEQFRNTYESLKPLNLIKNKFNEFIAEPDLKSKLLNTAMSIVAGYLSKKVMVGTTHNPVKQLLGTLLQMGVIGVVSKNSESIKSTVSNLLTAVLNKKNKVA